jgi:hypothetical protein
MQVVPNLFLMNNINQRISIHNKCRISCFNFEEHETCVKKDTLLDRPKITPDSIRANWDRDSNEIIVSDRQPAGE